MVQMDKEENVSEKWFKMHKAYKEATSHVPLPLKGHYDGLNMTGTWQMCQTHGLRSGLQRFCIMLQDPVTCCNMIVTCSHKIVACCNMTATWQTCQTHRKSYV